MGQQAGKSDRRVQRTKRLLYESLIELILQKGYDSVTIQDIIDKADVGRSTFYSHFESKEDLLLKGHGDITQLLLSSNEHINGGIDFLSLFSHAQEHGKVAKAMLGKSGGDAIISHIRDAMFFRITLEIEKLEKVNKDPIMNTLIAKAASASVLALLTSWLDSDMPIEPKEMATRATLLLNSILKVL